MFLTWLHIHRSDNVEIMVLSRAVWKLDRVASSHQEKHASLRHRSLSVWKDLKLRKKVRMSQEWKKPRIYIQSQFLSSQAYLYTAPISQFASITVVQLLHDNRVTVVRQSQVPKFPNFVVRLSRECRATFSLHVCELQTNFGPNFTGSSCDIRATFLRHTHMCRK